MARINIEDTFWVAVGRIERGSTPYDQVVGNAMRLLRFGQEQFKHSNFISIDQWQMEGFLEILVPVFATKNSDGYIIRDAEKQFGWLRQKVESGRRGGVASGESRRNDSNQLPEAARSGSKRLEPSSSSSSSEDLELLRNSSPSRKSAPVIFFVTNEHDLSGAIETDFWDKWREIYSPEYVLRERSKAALWCKANPKKSRKTPRGWVQFMAGWLERGWDKSTTQGPSNQPQRDNWHESAQKVAQCIRLSGDWTKDRDRIVEIMGEELYGLAIKAGPYRIRQLAANDFYLKNIIGLLKEAQLKQGGKT